MFCGVSHVLCPFPAWHSMAWSCRSTKRVVMGAGSTLDPPLYSLASVLVVSFFIFGRPHRCLVASCPIVSTMSYLAFSGYGCAM